MSSCRNLQSINAANKLKMRHLAKCQMTSTKIFRANKLVSLPAKLFQSIIYGGWKEGRPASGYFRVSGGHRVHFNLDLKSVPTSDIRELATNRQQVGWCNRKVWPDIWCIVRAPHQHWLKFISLYICQVKVWFHAWSVRVMARPSIVISCLTGVGS